MGSMCGFFKPSLFFIALFFVSHLGAFNSEQEVSMKIVSSAFKNGQTIPSQYTCMGKNVSPPLAISDVPPGTKSLALIMDDPDAPGGTFDHWVAWNIAADTKNLPEGVKLTNQGMNGFQKKGYGGPCPPPGKPHRYFFKLYALDISVDKTGGIKKSELEEAMKGHILATAELMGLFQK